CGSTPETSRGAGAEGPVGARERRIPWRAPHIKKECRSTPDEHKVRDGGPQDEGHGLALDVEEVDHVLALVDERLVGGGALGDDELGGLEGGAELGAAEDRRRGEDGLLAGVEESALDAGGERVLAGRVVREAGAARGHGHVLAEPT